MTVNNRRHYLRTASDAIVEMSHPSIGAMTVRARDLSEGGVSVDMGNQIAPPLGTEVDVIIKRHTGAINNEPVKMRVVHLQNDGSMGLVFI